jgi:hypothetical protein
MGWLDKATGNFWIDNGLVALHRLKNLPTGASVDTVRQHIVNRIYVETGNTGEYWDEQLQQIKTYKKRNWKEPIGCFIKAVDNTVPKIKIDGREYPTRPPESKIQIQPEGKSQRCDFCGEQGKVVEAKLYLFPFVVNPKDFGNFYSHARRGLKMCERCALAGLAAFESWLWRRQGDTYHFFLFHTDLDRLNALYDGFIGHIQLKQADQSGNFKAPFFGEYPFENLFGLILRLFEWIRERDSQQELDPLLAELTGAQPIVGNPIVLYAISGSYGGKSFSMRLLTHFDQFQPLYHLYIQWLDALRVSNPHQTLVQVFRQFQHRRQQRTETLWRDRICRAILQRADPLPVLEMFVYDVCARTEEKRSLAYGTLEVFETYAKEVMKMDQQLLDILRGFGYQLGSQAADRSEMGLLYALRNAKNLDQFLEVLNQIQFTLNVTINSELLRVESGERIAGVPWNRVKTLLAIHAMNAYLRKKYPQTSTQSEGGEQ